MQIKRINTLSAGILLLLTTLCSSPAVIAAEQVVTLDITGVRSVANCATQAVTQLQQSYILIDAPNPAEARGVLLLFVGGGGKLAVADAQLSITANNFLLRSRHMFAAQGYHVAVMDAANDFLSCNGGLRNRRTSGKFTTDMHVVVNDLRSRYPGLPVWLIGTSRGSTAAAQGAAFISPQVDGLVLTSSVTNPITSTVFDAPLANITMPTLIAYHENDTCFVSPPAGAEAIKLALTSASQVKVYDFDDGFPALSDNGCDATTPHGFLGNEAKVVKKITKWISKSISQ